MLVGLALCVVMVVVQRVDSFHSIAIRSCQMSKVVMMSSPEEGGKEDLKKAMLNARKNLESNSSPGAGLATADEQSDAAYADLINTSMDQRFNTSTSLFTPFFIIISSVTALLEDSKGCLKRN